MKLMYPALIKSVFFLVLFSCIDIASVYAQLVNPDSLFHPSQEHELLNSPARVIPITAEKLAWERMLPQGVKMDIKTSEMKTYELMMQRIKSGTIELALVVGEFELQQFEKPHRTHPKN